MTIMDSASGLTIEGMGEGDLQAYVDQFWKEVEAYD